VQQSLEPPLAQLGHMTLVYRSAIQNGRQFYQRDLTGDLKKQFVEFLLCHWDTSDLSESFRDQLHQSLAFFSDREQIATLVVARYLNRNQPVSHSQINLMSLTDMNGGLNRNLPSLQYPKSPISSVQLPVAVLGISPWWNGVLLM
jgi:hypothetical protein